MTEQARWTTEMLAELRRGLVSDLDAYPRRLMAEAARLFTREVRRYGPIRFAGVALPAAVHEAVRGERIPATFSAGLAATQISIDAIDDAMDGDAPRYWRSALAADRLLATHLLLVIGGQMVERAAVLAMSILDRRLATFPMTYPYTPTPSV